MRKKSFSNSKSNPNAREVLTFDGANTPLLWRKMPALNRSLLITLARYVSTADGDLPTLHVCKISEELGELRAAVERARDADALGYSYCASADVLNVMAEVSDVLHELAYLNDYGKGYTPDKRAWNAYSKLMSALATNDCLLQSRSDMLCRMLMLSRESQDVKQSLTDDPFDRSTLARFVDRVFALVAGVARLLEDDVTRESEGRGITAFRFLHIANMVKHACPHKGEPGLLTGAKSKGSFTPRTGVLALVPYVFDIVSKMSSYDDVVAEFSPVTCDRVQMGLVVSGPDDDGRIVIASRRILDKHQKVERIASYFRLSSSVILDGTRPYFRTCVSFWDLEKSPWKWQYRRRSSYAISTLDAACWHFSV